MAREKRSWIVSTFIVLFFCFAIYGVAKLFMKLVEEKEDGKKRPINGNRVDDINKKEPFVV